MSEKAAKFNSRKWKITQRLIALEILVPILYKYVGISDEVTLTMMGSIAAAAITYGGLNVLAKKWGQRD